MRIVGGSLKGRRFASKHMPHARPTTDRAKESVFNILDQHFYWENLDVLDLYSGLGSLALESYSRGAKSVDAVDKNIKSIKYIAETAKEWGADIKVHKADVLKFLKKCSNQYDLVFADPPYNRSDLLLETIQVVKEEGILKQGGWFVLEHETLQDIPKEYCFDQRVYGQSTFSFIKFD